MRLQRSTERTPLMEYLYVVLILIWMAISPSNNPTKKAHHG